MKITFSEIAWDDYQYWASQDKKTTKKINRLIEDIRRNPFEGIGKPEPLKHDLAGMWSRHIDDKNRIIYSINDHSEQIEIIQCRNHYKDK